MNIVVATGRLKSDPVISYTENKKEGDNSLMMAKYTLIQSQSKDNGWKNDLNFIPCICFGRTAQIAKDYLKQGKLVTIEGRFQGMIRENDGDKYFYSNIVVKKQIFDINDKQNTEEN